MFNLTLRPSRAALPDGAKGRSAWGWGIPLLLLTALCVTPAAQAQTVTADAKPPQGRIVSQRGPQGVTTTTYDAQGRVVSVTTPDGKTTNQQYATPAGGYDGNGHGGAAASPAPAASGTGSQPSSQATLSPSSLRLARSLSAGDLSVVPGPSVQQVSPGLVRHDFGTVSVLDTPRAEQTFLLKNNGRAPLTLARLQPSCACTTATVQGGGTALPTLQPGQQVPIHVTVDLKGHPAGPLTKSVSVFVQGQDKPAALLEMSGTLLPSVTFSASLLDFGTVGTGEARSLPLSVTLDSRLDQDAAPPMLVSSNPDVLISPAMQIVSGQAPASTKSTLAGKAAPASKTRTLAYTLTLARNAGVGPLSGSLYLVPSPAATLPPASKSAVPLSSVLASATVLVTGQVVGTVAAQPQTLSFGTVRMGQPATRRILLTGKMGADVQNLRASTSSSYFTAKLDTPPATASINDAPTSRILDVTLSADAPPGTVQSQLKVRLANGERLLIPLSAYVTPGAGF